MLPWVVQSFVILRYSLWTVSYTHLDVYKRQGLILSIVAASLLLELRISMGVPAIMMLAVVLGIIAFLLLEMIIRKNRCV